MSIIIPTVGPNSESQSVLQKFADLGVEIVRLKIAHNTSKWHAEVAKKCKELGLQVLLDLTGPKLILGDFGLTILDVVEGGLIILEKQDTQKNYPYQEGDYTVLPTLLEVTKFLQPKEKVLINDGKVELVVDKVVDSRAFLTVICGGDLSSHKTINLPQSNVDLDFLTFEDRQFLTDNLNEIKPEFVSLSFVKSVEDVRTAKEFLHSIVEDKGYFPQIVTKIETREALGHLEDIVLESDLIIVARGDLSLETVPKYFACAKYQQDIIKLCQKFEKRVVVATEILANMVDNPVPSRAEIGDLYHLLYVQKVDGLMLTNETAVGKYPVKCVELIAQAVESFGR